MRRLISLTAVLALLSFGACGGGDETTTDTGASGTSGAQDVSPGDGMSAGDFIDASLPDQAAEVETLVIDDPDCQDVNTKPGGQFQVAVAITAAQASPDTPLSEIVADQCGQG